MQAFLQTLWLCPPPIRPGGAFAAFGAGTPNTGPGAGHDTARGPCA